MAVASDSSGTPMKKGVKRKLSGGGGGTTTTDEEEPKFVPVVEGMSAAEVQMVKRLAGNDPAVRKKTVRKLKKWLKALSKKSPETRGKVASLVYFISFGFTAMKVVEKSKV